MYNGIGLQTARGSGTNGYVQRNLSLVRVSKPSVNYKTEDEIRRFESEYIRQPNQEILEHHRKRMIEVQCLELEEKLEKQGLTEEEIQKKVNEFRQDAIKKMKKTLENREEFIMEILNSKGVKETHQLAQLNQNRNDKLKSALGISEDFVAGSSMDIIRKAKEQQAAKEEMLRQNKDLIIQNTAMKNQQQQDKIPQPQPSGEPKPPSRSKLSSKSSSDSSTSSSSSSSTSSSESDSSDSSSDSSDSSSSSDSDDDGSSSSDDEKEARRRRGRPSKPSSSSSKKHGHHRKHDRHVEDDDISHHKRDERQHLHEKRRDKHHRSSGSQRSHRHRKDDMKQNDDSGRSKKHSKTSGDWHRSRYHREPSPAAVLRNRQSVSLSPPPQAPAMQTLQRTLKSKIEPRRPRLSRTPERRRRQRSPVSSDEELRHRQRHQKRSRDDDRHDHHQRPKRQSLESVVAAEEEYSHDDSADSMISDRSESQSPRRTGKPIKKGYSRSRSPSIPRRQGSPSFLEKRRITSARKRPVPYRRTDGGSRSPLGSSSAAGSIGGHDSISSLELSPPLRYRQDRPF